MSHPALPQANAGHLLALDSRMIGGIALQARSPVLFCHLVNALLERGDRRTLATLAFAQGGGTDPLRTYVLHRTLGDPKGAFTALSEGDLVLNMLADAVVTAEEFDHDLAARLLSVIGGIGGDYSGVPTFHAFLHRRTAAHFGEEAAGRLAGTVALGRTAEGVRVVGITKVKNEGPRVEALVHVLLGVCDAAVVYDDGSSDGSVDALEGQFDAETVRVVRGARGALFDERVIYWRLFEAARALGATHLMMLDADEVLSPALADRETLRSVAAALLPGESAAVPWRQFLGDQIIDHDPYLSRVELSRFLAPYKDLIWCDDGAATHRDLALHNPWLPDARPSRRRFLHDPAHAIWHLERALPANARLKVDWYVAKEIVEYGSSLDTVLARYLPQALIAVHGAVHTVAPDAPLPDLSIYAEPQRARIEETARLAARVPEDMRGLLFHDWWC